MLIYIHIRQIFSVRNTDLRCGSDFQQNLPHAPTPVTKLQVTGTLSHQTIFHSAPSHLPSSPWACRKTQRIQHQDILNIEKHTIAGGHQWREDWRLLHDWREYHWQRVALQLEFDQLHCDGKLQLVHFSVFV